VDAGAKRIRELERGFRRDGLPTLIVDAPATEEIFPRALPFLMVVFVVELLDALEVKGGWTNLLLGLGGVLLLGAAFGTLNVMRGRRFLSIPDRLSSPALVAFVVLPGVLSAVFDGRFQGSLSIIVVNVAIVALVYVVVGFALLSVVRWACARLFVHLGASMTALIRAVPLLLLFSLISFFTAEIWQVFATTGSAAYWTAIGMFVVLAMGFLIVRMPGVVSELQVEAYIGEVPLRRRERLNLATVALLCESLQVLFVSAAVWLFYVVLGTLVVPADVRSAWLDQPDNVIWDISWFGDRLQVTSQLLRVATAVAAFTALYYAVTMLLDAAYRDQFVDALGKDLRGTFERRSEYHDLLARQGVAVVSGEPRAEE
jgi:hypothetical protein